ncbi:hypothetical protein AA958_00295 [Streptomyces sp. CNQ-509]|uniref:hypothetical protein n=1 Tax=unclassified Streptomyces TaxID=2593676 RepID=UPI00062DFBCB|nr:hypothetical protein [Streptomyces sp. CNQ-509]AKH80864.1 hypothetical protein AA958_00295 [Streptomyces sp. CNQ-509]
MASTQGKLREQVDTARGRLGGGVEGVKDRAQKGAADVKRVVDDKTPDRVRHAAGRAGHVAERAARTGKKRPVPAATAVGGAVLALVFLLFRRSRRNGR